MFPNHSIRMPSGPPKALYVREISVITSLSRARQSADIKLTLSAVWMYIKNIHQESKQTQINPNPFVWNWRQSKSQVAGHS